MNTKKQSETGRSLLETLSVLIVMVILLLAGIVGYRAVLHYWKKNETVKGVSELTVRYKTRPIAPEDGKVDIKYVYPEADRADAVTLRVADAGRVHLEVEEDPTNFLVIVNEVLDDSCEAILMNGEYDAVLYKDGNEKYDPQKHYFAIGRELLRNWDNKKGDLRDDFAQLKELTKEDLIAK